MKATVILKRIDSSDYGQILPVPMYDKGRDELNRIGEGEIRKMEIKNPRNIRLHNLYMAEIRMVVNNCLDANDAPKWRSVEHLRKSVLIMLGLYDVVPGLDGNPMILEHSMSFESMDEDEFREMVFEPAQPLLANELGITIAQLQNIDHVEEYLQ